MFNVRRFHHKGCGCLVTLSSIVCFSLAGYLLLSGPKDFGEAEVCTEREMMERFGNPYKIIGSPRSIFEQTEEEVRRIKDFTSKLVEGCESDYEKAEAIIKWVHKSFEYENLLMESGPKTIPEMFEKRAGNCYNQALVAMLMARSIGIPTRLVFEIKSEEPSLLNTLAIFLTPFTGYNYNNHIWLEFFVDGDWEPGDPLWGAFGMAEWLEARLLSEAEGEFLLHPRYAYRVSGKDFPLIIYAEKGNGVCEDMEGRTEYYLIRAFGGFYGLSETKEFTVWRRHIEHFAALGSPAGFRRSTLLKEIWRIGKARRSLEDLIRKHNLRPKGRWNINFPGRE